MEYTKRRTSLTSEAIKIARLGWPFFLFIAVIIGLFAATVISLRNSNERMANQPIYSDNANLVLKDCMNRLLDYHGEILDCLADAGFTLTYNGEPVTRQPAANGQAD